MEEEEPVITYASPENGITSLQMIKEFRQKDHLLPEFRYIPDKYYKSVKPKVETWSNSFKTHYRKGISDIINNNDVASCSIKLPELHYIRSSNN